MRRSLIAAGREARAEGDRGARLGERAGLGGGGGGKGVNGAGGKIPAEFERPAVGRQFDFRAALLERRSERGCGKKMSARAARRNQDRTRRSSSLRRRGMVEISGGALAGQRNEEAHAEAEREQ